MQCLIVMGLGGAPPPFEFNRHGLLNGLRDRTTFEQLNCSRLFIFWIVLPLARPTTIRGASFRALTSSGAYRLTKDPWISLRKWYFWVTLEPTNALPCVVGKMV
jgi:hypothetical protein